MKKILGLTIAVLLIIGIVGVGTWAYFSDTATSTGNTWTAGTLVLSESTTGTVVNATMVGAGPSVNGSVQFGLIKPGSSGTITWTLTNTGNLPGILTMPAGASPLTNTSFTGGPNGDLGLFMGFNLQRGPTYIVGASGTYFPFCDLQAALVTESSLNNSIAAGGSLVYTLSWSVATDIVGLGGTSGTAIGAPVDDNLIQGDTAQLDISFTLTQS